MVRKRIIGTIVTVALGLSLVGVANADSIDSLMTPKGIDSKQSITNITQQDMKSNMQNFTDFSEVQEQPNTKEEAAVATEDTDKEKQEIAKDMIEFHEENYDKMLEIHESMTQNQMHENFENGNAAMNQMGPQMHGGGMNSRNMMGY